MNHSMAPPRTKKKGSRRYGPNRSRPGTNRSRRRSRRLISMAGSPSKEEGSAGRCVKVSGKPAGTALCSAASGPPKAAANQRGATPRPSPPRDGVPEGRARSHVTSGVPAPVSDWPRRLRGRGRAGRPPPTPPRPSRRRPGALGRGGARRPRPGPLARRGGDWPPVRCRRRGRPGLAS